MNKRRVKIKKRQQLVRAGAAAAFLAFFLGTAAPPALAQQPPAEPSIAYTVKPKDKLIGVTALLLLRRADWPEVARFNRLKNPNRISPGQIIQVPLRLMKSQPVSGKIVSVYGDVQLAAPKPRLAATLPKARGCRPASTAPPCWSWLTAAASRCCPTRWPNW